ncbi:LCP family protein [Streptomyces lavendofoliae]|uniref:Transcriptional regulator n=1 Tax=Streptomyces lavendofoliae TaxID=67314 RepID=A0A918HXK4_9ACTN|nr:LCP family protein [Streptomyces lavendofoliae]GGU34014.1 transcriptional regulator [Streptomyces lavendofoliae]
MNDGWTDDRNARYGRGSADAQPEGARVMRHVQRPAAPPQRPPVPHQQSQGYDAYDSGYNTGQVYGSPAGGGRGGGRADRGSVRAPGPAPDWRRRIKVGSIVALVAVLGTTIGTYFWADGKVRREVDLAKVIDRPKEGDCTTYLIVGSDSREGMTAEEKKKLHTGSAEGKRTDSMMILAACGSGNTMISLPRDSDVEIPKFVGSESGKTFPAQGRRVKLNAAYAEDGPELLVRTVEHNTGLRIDHYAEIGFAGFANIVDALGGVEMDIPKAFKDKKSGADFQAGKQTLNGEQSLAFVRTRYAFAGSDLDRTKNQQKFLATLANQAATPGTLLNPFRLYPTLGAGLDTLIVDKDMSLFDLGEMFFAMKGISGGDGKSMNIPISGSTGGNLVWDKAKVQQLVQQIQNDEKVTVTGN